jgi:tRNA pseudouridine38-40 synthase
MPRYKLTIEYDGTGLVGWQRQTLGDSVQGLIESAFEKLTGQAIFVQGGGRTDAGVHALGQVAHADLPRTYRPDEIQGALNFFLKPARIAILAAEPVSDQFHARISATGRGYLYRILNRRAPPAIDRHQVWHVPGRLDAAAMAAGARYLVGHHDFTSFRAADCQSLSPEKTMDRLEIRKSGDEIHLVAEARSFLYHQIRNIVGTLNLVGLGQWQPEDVDTALKARNRAAAGPTAPPDGLYLTKIDYDSAVSR